MYLTAQRVVSPSSGATGVNAYCYIHGFDWTSPPDSILDALPNEPSSEHIEVPPPGNRVRSYLDIAVPDSASAEELSEAFHAFVAAHREQELPWCGVYKRCAFRLGMEQSLASSWRAEVAALLRAVAMTLGQAGR